MIGLEIMQQAPLAAVGENFIVDMEKYFRRQHFHLEVHLVTNATGKSPGGALLAAKAITEQRPSLGQRLVGGRDFRQVNIAIAPSDHVAGSSNPHGNLGVLPLNLPHGEDIKQLGMQWPSIELENQVANPRSQ
jgi:hypothetical protein